MWSFINLFSLFWWKIISINNIWKAILKLAKKSLKILFLSSYSYFNNYDKSTVFLKFLFVKQFSFKLGFYEMQFLLAIPLWNIQDILSSFRDGQDFLYTNIYICVFQRLLLLGFFSFLTLHRFSEHVFKDVLLQFL